MALASCMSIGGSRWNRRKVRDLETEIYHLKQRVGMDQELAKKQAERNSYQMRWHICGCMTLGLWSMAANYTLFSMLRRQGYLAQVSDLCKKDPTYKRALVAAPLFSMFMGKKMLHDNQHSTRGIILLVEPLMAAITYALWFSKG